MSLSISWSAHVTGSVTDDVTFMTTVTREMAESNVNRREMTDQSAAEKSVRPKSSKAWEHFTLNAANKTVICKLCKAELVWHGSTTVMHEHMKRKHVVTDEGETSAR